MKQRAYDSPFLGIRGFDGHDRAILYFSVLRFPITNIRPTEEERDLKCLTCYQLGQMLDNP